MLGAAQPLQVAAQALQGTLRPGTLVLLQLGCPGLEQVGPDIAQHRQHEGHHQRVTGCVVALRLPPNHSS